MQDAGSYHPAEQFNGGFIIILNAPETSTKKNS